MTATVEVVLAGTSLELSSDAVVLESSRLARRLDAELHLFHAHSLPVAYFAGPSGMTTITPDLLETERQVRQRLLEEQLERIGVDRARVAGSVIEAGAPHRMLLETADRVAADLIVIGSSETPGRRSYGTTADRVLRKSTCPVWVLKGETSQIPPRRLLAPVDLSPLSEESLAKGLDVVDQLHGAIPEVTALFVLTREELESSAQFSAEQIERMARDELQRFSQHVEREDRPLRRKLRIGEIRGEILAELEDIPADLMVLGTHGRSGFERFLLGSVASDMASRSPCSVLVIPPDQPTS